MPFNDLAIGVDVGLASFATLSSGEKVPNPRFFRQDEKELAKAQRKLSKTEKGMPERAKRRKAVQHVH
jgi:putative transposase